MEDKGRGRCMKLTNSMNIQILTALWKIQQGKTPYEAPGGPVWSEAAPNANRAGS